MQMLFQYMQIYVDLLGFYGVPKRLLALAVWKKGI